MPRDVHRQSPPQETLPIRTPRRTPAAIIRARDIETAIDTERHAMALFDENARLVRANGLYNELLACANSPELQTADPRERARIFDVRDMDGRRLPTTRLPVLRALRGDALVGAVGVDLRVRALDGRELILHVTATALSTRSDRVTSCVVVLHDMTEAQRLADVLQEIAGRVATLSQVIAVRNLERDVVFDAIADGVLLYDPSGRLLYVNSATRALLGIHDGGPGEAAARVARQLDEYAQYDVEAGMPPRDAWPLARVLRGETVAGGDAADAIRRLPDGSEQVLNISAAPMYLEGRLAGAVLILRDVTERRRLEREAAEHAKQVEAIFEAMADGLVYYDAAGRVVRMNTATRQLLGYDAAAARDVVVQRPWTEHPALRDASGEHSSLDEWPLVRILTGEIITSERAVDVHVWGPEGRLGMLAVSGAPIYDNEGRVILAVVSIRDVTEARRLDDERAQMMNTVSHELKTPLSVVAMAHGLIDKRAILGQPPSSDTIDVLADGIAQMTRLVNDLVDAARAETGQLAVKPVPQDLRLVCRTVVAEQMRAVERVITLREPSQPTFVDADTIRISQVLTNLLSNALKYSPPDRPVSVRLQRKKGVARVEVHDDGPGIPPESKPHLFERFYRVPGMKVLHGLSDGLGLGLYIARTLVELHGGKIDVESEERQGATFWFTLPLLSPVVG